MSVWKASGFQGRESTTKRDYDEANPPVNAILLAIASNLRFTGDCSR